MPTPHLPPYRNPDLPVAQRIADLLDRMTLEEKVAQIYCLGRTREMEGILFDEDGRILRDKMAELCRHGLGQLGRPSQPNTPRAAAIITNALQQFLAQETRLGIPALFNEEGLHGLMAKGATSFPTAIALASTWNEKLVQEIFTAVARETRARGSNYIYTPVLDLARDPRWGRVEETFGEDPYLVARLGVAAIRGLQGDSLPIGPEHVIACAKHYAVHGQPEGGLNAGPVNVSERIIREEFLPPFQAAVQEAGVQAIMASYNEVDAIPVHINRWLLQQVLRDEWKYEGFVTSDGFGVPQLEVLHHVAADRAEAGRLALEAGIDAEVPQGVCFTSLVEQARQGRVSQTAINRAVANILRGKIMLSLLDETPYVDPDEAERINNCAAHRQLALQAAHEAAVLLKNENNTLPLREEALGTIAVIGPNAADLHLGAYAADPGRGSSVLDGIRERAGAGINVIYAEGCRLTDGAQGQLAWHVDEVTRSDPADDTPRIAAAVRTAREADVAILVLGGNESTCREGWWFNHLGDRDELNLLGRQEELVAAVLATGTPTVVVLINGRPLTIPNLVDSVPAILECWYLGQETGTAVADILFGDVNPSGKLPVTFPRSVGQLPVYYYHRPSAKRGYLFSSTEPMFPFGYGLSYTEFSYANLRLNRQQIGVDETAIATVEVTNDGSRAGAEVVQLYIRDLVSSVTRPVQLLKGFRRIELSPGETKSVSFKITPDKLALLNQEMAWCVEPGLFHVMIGPHAAETQTVPLEVVL